MSKALNLYRQKSPKPSPSSADGGKGAPARPKTRDADTGEMITWPELIRIGSAPEPPAFPHGVLPEPLAKLSREMADSLNCLPDMPAVAMLAMASGAIGASRSLAVKRNYVESAALYLCIVAPPGGAKSPILKMLRGPFDARQQSLLDAFKDQIESWKKQNEESRDPKPVCERVVVADATVESLGLILSENPRGMLMVRDELVSLVHGLNQYKGGKGADRQFYLSTWSGDPVTVDRKSDKERHGAPLFVVHPILGIVGGVQPDVVACLRGERSRGAAPPNDGFLDRFLFAWPATPPAKGETWKSVSDASLADWSDVIDFLLRLEMIEEDGRKRSRVLRLSRCGKAAWEKLTAEHAAETNDERFPEHLVGPWVKLKAYAARLALIVHLLRIACGEIANDDVDGESMTRAWKLVAYFKAHVRKVYAEMDVDGRLVGLRKLVRWIETCAGDRFNQRDAYQALKGTFPTVAELEPVFELAQERGYIHPIAESSRKGPGRKPKSFAIHPEVFGSDSHNPHKSQNGRRRF